MNLKKKWVGIVLAAFLSVVMGMTTVMAGTINDTWIQGPDGKYVKTDGIGNGLRVRATKETIKFGVYVTPEDINTCLNGLCGLQRYIKTPFNGPTPSEIGYANANTLFECAISTNLGEVTGKVTTGPNGTLYAECEVPNPTVQGTLKLVNFNMYIAGTRMGGAEDKSLHILVPKECKELRASRPDASHPEGIMNVMAAYIGGDQVIPYLVKVDKNGMTNRAKGWVSSYEAHKMSKWEVPGGGVPYNEDEQMMGKKAQK
jgi:hypothetical protein